MKNEFKINSYNDLLSALKKLNPNVEFITDFFDEWIGSSVTLDKLILPKGFYWIGGQEINDCRSITNRGNNEAGMDSLCIAISTVSKIQDKAQTKDNKYETVETRKVVHCTMKKYGIKREIQRKKEPLMPSHPTPKHFDLKFDKQDDLSTEK